MLGYDEVMAAAIEANEQITNMSGDEKQNHDWLKKFGFDQESVRQFADEQAPTAAMMGLGPSDVFMLGFHLALETHARQNVE